MGPKRLWRWAGRSALGGLLLLAGCGGVGAGATTTTTAAPSSTTETTTTVVPVTTGSSTAAGLDAEAVVAFAEWTAALYAGDYQFAWDLMAPSSRAALGSFDLFESFGSEMTEGWGAWSLAKDVTVTVDEDEAGRTRAVFSGVVEREGMVESAVTTVYLAVEGDMVMLSPFEEFGNVAVGLQHQDTTVPVPEGSGSGRRLVYSNSQQRVWMIEADGAVVDTYLVSGREGVPQPGEYEVFSKSETAYAGHDGITMRYMVRFTHAESGLAIGFHSIPNRANGDPMQTEDQLGEFHSAGCVRQSLGHAAALYEWADEGTKVVVLA